MPRKTADQRREATERAGRLAERRFFLELNSIRTLREADAFANSGRAPRQGEPGGILYTHLGTFLFWAVGNPGHLPPEHLSQAEKEAFRELLKRSDAEGELQPGLVGRLIEELMRA